MSYGTNIEELERADEVCRRIGGFPAVDVERYVKTLKKSEWDGNILMHKKAKQGDHCQAWRNHQTAVHARSRIDFWEARIEWS